MKIALAQMKVVPANPQLNVDTMKRMIQSAQKKGAKIIAFPELCISGYLVGDEFLKDDFCFKMMEYGNKIKKFTSIVRDIAVIFGNVYIEKSYNKFYMLDTETYHSNEDGRLLRYNAAYAFMNGKPLLRQDGLGSYIPTGVCFKTLLPNYRFFDEKRYFSSLLNLFRDCNGPNFSTENLRRMYNPFIVPINDHKNILVGVTLCEDLWCKDYRFGNRAINPIKMLIENRSNVILNLSASPWTCGKNKARHNAIQYVKNDYYRKCPIDFDTPIEDLPQKTHQTDPFVPIGYVNCVGIQNNGKNIITFDGSSTVYGSDAIPRIVSENTYQEDLIIFNHNTIDNMEIAHPQEKSKIQEKYDAIIEAMRSFVGNKKIVIGLSGGIDSAVVAALSVQAVGKENVICANMPTIYNSQQTKDAAQHVANLLGVKYITIPISNIINEVELQLKYAISEINGISLIPSIVEENIQAKIRSTDILSNLAQSVNGLYTCNGNKNEVFLGYATLDGDWRGAIAPIADLLKYEVYEMAKYLNDKIYKTKIIPENLINQTIIPSAELQYNQQDPIKIGYHCKIIEALMDYKKKSPDDIVQWWLEGTMKKHLGISHHIIKQYHVDIFKNFIEDLEWLMNKYYSQIFKRVQSVPLVVTSKTAFGYDLRESILPPEATWTIPESLKCKYNKRYITSKKTKFKISEKNTKDNNQPLMLATQTAI